MPGQRDSVTFFSIRLKGNSLARRPDGSAFGPRDSALITLTLVDAQRGIVDCQPSGLVFARNAPARIKISFAEDDQDLNHDGRVDQTDAAITRALAIWLQETSTTPWLPLVSKVDTGLHEIEADIGGFTSYAIAY